MTKGMPMRNRSVNKYRNFRKWQMEHTVLASMRLLLFSHFIMPHFYIPTGSGLGTGMLHRCFTFNYEGAGNGTKTDEQFG